jgi:hypothetical protein
VSAEARRFADAIQAVGGTAFLLRGGERLPFTASIQPRLTAREPDSEPLGIGAARLYNLYAAAAGNGPSPERGDTVEWRGRTYCVESAETFTFQDEDVYYHAVLRKGAQA